MLCCDHMNHAAVAVACPTECELVAPRAKICHAVQVGSPVGLLADIKGVVDAVRPQVIDNVLPDDVVKFLVAVQLCTHVPTETRLSKGLRSCRQYEKQGVASQGMCAVG